MHQSCSLLSLTWMLAVQGVVEARQLKDREGQPYTLALFARRSRLHPGMRYIARGLNALASPGNEIECEQVCCPDPACCCMAGHAYPCVACLKAQP